MENEIGLLFSYGPAELNNLGLRRLVGAVLVQAARDYQNGSLGEKIDAAAWIRENGADWASTVGISFPGGVD